MGCTVSMFAAPCSCLAHSKKEHRPSNVASLTSLLLAAITEQLNEALSGAVLVLYVRDLEKFLDMELISISIIS